MSQVRQYVAVRFRSWDSRTYTYHNDGAPVFAGDRVRVETARGVSVVTVESVDLMPPAFATKSIIGLAPEKPEAA